MIKRKVDWLEKYSAQIISPRYFSEQSAVPYIGQYGPRGVRLEGQSLTYQREGGQAQTLVQVEENVFILPKVINFRLEFVFGDGDKAEKVVGRYGDNYSDENFRSK